MASRSSKTDTSHSSFPVAEQKLYECTEVLSFKKRHLVPTASAMKSRSLPWSPQGQGTGAELLDSPLRPSAGPSRVSWNDQDDWFSVATPVVDSDMETEEPRRPTVPTFGQGPILPEILEAWRQSLADHVIKDAALPPHLMCHYQGGETWLTEVANATFGMVSLRFVNRAKKRNPARRLTQEEFRAVTGRLLMWAAPHQFLDPNVASWRRQFSEMEKRFFLAPHLARSATTPVRAAVQPVAPRHLVPAKSSIPAATSQPTSFVEKPQTICEPNAIRQITAEVTRNVLEALQVFEDSGPAIIRTKPQQDTTAPSQPSSRARQMDGATNIALTPQDRRAREAESMASRGPHRHPAERRILERRSRDRRLQKRPRSRSDIREDPGSYTNTACLTPPKQILIGDTNFTRAPFDRNPYL